MKIKVALLAVVLGTTSYATEFHDVIRHPRAFHNRVISVIGLAMVEVDRFYLFENVSAASKVDLSRAIYVRQGANVSSYDRFNNRWVELTGIVDADEHGPLGGLPCEISLKRVQLLNRPAEKQWPGDLGLFKNDTGSTVRVFLSKQAHHYYGIFGLGPGGVGGMAVSPGTVAVVTLIPQGTEKSVVLVPEDERIATVKLLIPARNHRRDEPTQRVLYYRITKGKIELVPAQEAKDWPVPSGFAGKENWP
jgi:hypothetical protein